MNNIDTQVIKQVLELISNLHISSSTKEQDEDRITKMQAIDWLKLLLYSDKEEL